MESHSHLKLVGLVGSIANDMSLTDLTIGAPTALKRICEAIDNINSTVAIMFMFKFVFSYRH